MLWIKKERGGTRVKHGETIRKGTSIRTENTRDEIGRTFDGRAQEDS